MKTISKQYFSCQCSEDMELDIGAQGMSAAELVPIYKAPFCFFFFLEL